MHHQPCSEITSTNGASKRPASPIVGWVLWVSSLYKFCLAWVHSSSSCHAVVTLVQPYAFSYILTIVIIIPQASKLQQGVQWSCGKVQSASLGDEATQAPPALHPSHLFCAHVCELLHQKRNASIISSYLCWLGLQETEIIWQASLLWQWFMTLSMTATLRCWVFG